VAFSGELTVKTYTIADLQAAMIRNAAKSISGDAPGGMIEFQKHKLEH
jgi:hypothetical protein